MSFRNNFFDLLRQIEDKFDFDKNKTVLTENGARFWDKRFNLLNITIYADCLIYHELEKKIDISTEVGVKGYGYNQNLFPKLRHSSPAVRNINQIYDGCTFNRFIRLFASRRCYYFWIKYFPALENYLDAVKNFPIVRPKVPREICIKDLKSLNPNVQIAGYLPNYQIYHWLEYLRITELVDGAPLEDEESFLQSVEKAVARHIEGMKFINTIQRA